MGSNEPVRNECEFIYEIFRLLNFGCFTSAVQYMFHIKFNICFTTAVQYMKYFIYNFIDNMLS